MQTRKMIVALAAILLAAGGAVADVRNMGPGLTSLETVPVDDPGNAGEFSSAGDEMYGYVPGRICGAVGYTYNIGKYEVTAGQYTEFLNKVAGVDTYGLYDTSMRDPGEDVWGCNIVRHGGGTDSNPYVYTVDSDWANRPVNYVNFWAACRFANWLHNGQPSGAQIAGTTETGAYTLNGYNGADGRNIQRNTDWKWAVTSEDEWYKAAYYKGGSTDAGYWNSCTGSDNMPGNVGWDGYSDPGNNANYNITGHMDGFAIGSPYYRTNVGEFENSASPYGTFDQAGNVWEFNEATFYRDSLGVTRGVRGGSFWEGGVNLSASYRHHNSVAVGSQTVGFRVSEVPEPATLALLALGGLAMLRRKKRRRPGQVRTDATRLALAR